MPTNQLLLDWCQRMTNKSASRFDLGPLHTLLLLACPRKEDAPGSIPGTLAPALGVSYQYVYRWIADGRVPAKFVTKIVLASEGRVSVEELIPFVIS